MNNKSKIHLGVCGAYSRGSRILMIEKITIRMLGNLIYLVDLSSLVNRSNLHLKEK